MKLTSKDVSDFLNNYKIAQAVIESGHNFSQIVSSIDIDLKTAITPPLSYTTTDKINKSKIIRQLELVTSCKSRSAKENVLRIRLLKTNFTRFDLHTIPKIFVRVYKNILGIECYLFPEKLEKQLADFCNAADEVLYIYCSEFTASLNE